MFKFFTSFGASSNFEKYRLQATAKNTEAPEESVMKSKTAYLNRNFKNISRRR